MLMDHKSVPHAHNSAGYASISLGVKSFNCMGALPPFDHPHIAIDMGVSGQIVCPYCSTLYLYDPSLSARESKPAGCIA